MDADNYHISSINTGMANYVRFEAQDKVSFTENTAGVFIFFTVVKSLWANILMGSLCNADEHNVDAAIVYPIIPNGRKNTRNICYSALAYSNLEGCCRAVYDKKGRLSSDTSDEDVAKGASNRKGAVCFDVVSKKIGDLFGDKKAEEIELCFDTDEKRFVVLRIYVSVMVDGASDAENESYALSAEAAINRFVAFLPEEYEFSVVAPRRKFE